MASPKHHQQQQRCTIIDDRENNRNNENKSVNLNNENNNHEQCASEEIMQETVNINNICDINEEIVCDATNTNTDAIHKNVQPELNVGEISGNNHVVILVPCESPTTTTTTTTDAIKINTAMISSSILEPSTPVIVQNAPNAATAGPLSTSPQFPSSSSSPVSLEKHSKYNENVVVATCAQKGIYNRKTPTCSK